MENNEEDQSEKRLDICRSCDRLLRLTGQCKECGCFVFLKTKIKSQHCPINKW